MVSPGTAIDKGEDILRPDGYRGVAAAAAAAVVENGRLELP